MNQQNIPMSSTICEYVLLAVCVFTWLLFYYLYKYTRMHFFYFLAWTYYSSYDKYGNYCMRHNLNSSDDILCHIFADLTGILPLVVRFSAIFFSRSHCLRMFVCLFNWMDSHILMSHVTNHDSLNNSIDFWCTAIVDRFISFEGCSTFYLIHQWFMTYSWVRLKKIQRKIIKN